MSEDSMAKINVVNFMTNVDRSSWVHDLDPRTKFALILFFSSIPLFFTDWRFILFFVILSIPLWLTANLNFRPMAGPLIGVAYFLLIIFLLNAVRGSAELVNQNPANAYTWFIKLGPIVVTSHTATRGLFMALRLLTSMTIGLLVIATTDPTLLAKGLRMLKFPISLVFMVLAGLRFIPIVTEQLFNIMDAQTIRGVKSSRLQRTKLMILPLFITSLRRVRMLGLASEAKGFGAGKWNNFYEEFILSNVDKVVLISILIVTLITILLRFGFSIGSGGIYYGT
jgi:energy-coupling factor transport system permease protein